MGYDSNKYLIALLNKAKENPDALYDSVSREFYNMAKDEYNSGNIMGFEDWQIGNIGFLASYNAKFFGGYAGIVHTKIGTIRNYYDESRRNLMAQSENFKDIVFKCKKYEQCNEFQNAVIYCDPPYESATKYLDDIDHMHFWNYCREISKCNVVLISEHNAPNDFIPVWQQEITRTIDNKKRIKATEKLFVHRSNLKYVK